MCLVCDIINNRIPKETAQKINADNNLRVVYDALRGPNCEGEPIKAILEYFQAHNWKPEEIRDVSVDWCNKIKEKAKKKKELKKEAAVLK